MKMEGVCCLFPGKSVFRQQVYVFFSKSQAAGKFLYHAATQVFPFIARYRNNTYSRIRPAGFHQFCQSTYVFFPELRTFKKGISQRIKGKTCPYSRRVGFRLLQVFQESIQRIGSGTIHSFKRQFNGRHVHPLKQNRYILLFKFPARFQTKTHRLGPSLQSIQHQGIYFFQVVLHNKRLPYKPVVVFFCAPYMKHSFQIFGPVIGTNLEPIGCFPYQFFIIISSLQIFNNLLFPLLSGNRWKIFE